MMEGITIFYIKHCAEDHCFVHEELADVRGNFADIHLVNGKLELAETERLEILERYNEINFQELHYIYDLLAVTYRYNADFNKCIFYGSKAKECSDTAQNTISVKAAFSVSGKISRKEFGLTWNAVTEAGAVVVGDEIKFQAEIQLVKQVLN